MQVREKGPVHTWKAGPCVWAPTRRSWEMWWQEPAGTQQGSTWELGQDERRHEEGGHDQKWEGAWTGEVSKDCRRVQGLPGDGQSFNVRSHSIVVSVRVSCSNGGLSRLIQDRRFLRLLSRGERGRPLWHVQRSVTAGWNWTWLFDSRCWAFNPPGWSSCSCKLTCSSEQSLV